MERLSGERWGEVVINRCEQQHEELLRVGMEIFFNEIISDTATEGKIFFNEIVAKSVDNWLCWSLSI